MIEHGCAKVEVIKHSISPEGIKLVTLQARYPRMIHAELLTHRIFSKNGRSSRAVPTLTLLQEDPYYPIFQKNQPGMSAGEVLDDEDQAKARDVWERMIKVCDTGAKALKRIGVHKQWANRPTEWFGYIDVLISTTGLKNFVSLRDDDDAQPEMRDLAKGIIRATEEVGPTKVSLGEWHLPYITDDEQEEYSIDILRKISVARCARVSYKPFDGNGNVESELERYSKLVESRPVHASPTEHVATPDTLVYKNVWAYPEQHRNYKGWRQFRATLPGETMED